MKEFWGEPISVYTDEQAVADGVLVDVRGLFPAVWKLSLVTRAVWEAYTKPLLGGAMTDVSVLTTTLRTAWENARSDRDWRIGTTRDGREVWFVPNGMDGMTAIFPEDY